MNVSEPVASRSGRAGTTLPAWALALVVIAHPDDESFGLGAVIDQLTAAGAAVHILCFTHGGASTLDQTQADLHRAKPSCARRPSNSGWPVSRCWITPMAVWPVSRRASLPATSRMPPP